MTAPRPIVRARMRYQRCQDISTAARFVGLDTTPDRVNRKYEIWERWYQGRLTTGYLLRITGTKRIERESVVIVSDTSDGRCNGRSCK